MKQKQKKYQRFKILLQRMLKLFITRKCKKSKRIALKKLYQKKGKMRLVRNLKNDKANRKIKIKKSMKRIRNMLYLFLMMM
jgi:hypothetical protein